MTFARVFFAVLVFSVAAHAEEKPRPFKNLQILKRATHSDIDMSMKFISGALGVGCEYCHVQAQGGPWPMEKDDKLAKRTARKMMTMSTKINRDFFGGKQVVTCVTCHKGHAEPPETVSLETVWPEPQKPEGEPKPPTVTVKEVLDKYAQAAGGRAAWERLHTRVAKGKLMFGPTQEMPLEVTLSAPDKYLARLTTPNGEVTQGYDGKAGWQKSAFGVRTPSALDAADMARDGRFFTPIQLAAIMTDLKALPDATVGKTPAHVLEGRAFGCLEQLYFDAATGLMVRRVARMATPLGDLAEQIDYDDWKTVDGVKVPFTVKRNSGGELQVEKYGAIQHNVAVDDALFARPEK